MTLPLTRDQIAAIQARAEKATPGPWCYENIGEKENTYAVGVAWLYDDENVQASGKLDNGDDQYYTEAVCFTEDGTLSTGGSVHTNAEFISHAREDVPALCQQALRAIELEEQNSFWIGEINNLQVKMDVLKSELTATRKALEEERERCAKVAERWAGDVDEDGCLVTAPEGIASRIRALPAPEVKP